MWRGPAGQILPSTLLILLSLPRYKLSVRTYGSYTTYGILPRSTNMWRIGGTVTVAYRLVSASWRGPAGQILPSTLLILLCLPRNKLSVRRYGSYTTYGILPRSTNMWRVGGTVTVAYRPVFASWRGPAGRILPSTLLILLSLPGTYTESGLLGNNQGAQSHGE